MLQSALSFTLHSTLCSDTWSKFLSEEVRDLSAPISPYNVEVADQSNCCLTGLLMRPEHSETKVKIEARECETKTEIETETETKKLLWDRDQKLRDWDRDRDQSIVNSVAYESKKIGVFYRRLYIWNNKQWIIDDDDDFLLVKYS